MEPEQIAENDRSWFCAFGHEHADFRAALNCDSVWDNSRKGSLCALHDAGMTEPCTCTPTLNDGTGGER